MGNCFGLSWFTSGLMGKSSFVGKSLMFKGFTMYKVDIDISAWGGDEKVVIETNDFDKVQIIQKFIDFQIEHGWAADYALVDLEEDEEDDGIDEDEEEPSTISTYIVTKVEE
jgi:hypothetical protein